MTVHKAKGLEFPVVILADLTCRMSRTDASRYLDASRGLCAIKIGGWAPHELHEHEAEEVARDEAEGVRLAYVAATRARDLLVVPALGDDPWEGGWLSPLNAALYPPTASRRTATRGPKCPVFKSKDSVLRAAERRTGGPRRRCVPASTRSRSGYSVVWWDPSALTLGAKPPLGVRRDELIVKDVPRDVVADGRDAVRPVAAGAASRRESRAPCLRSASVPCASGSRCNVAAEAQRTQSKPTVALRSEVSVSSVPLWPRDPGSRPFRRRGVWYARARGAGPGAVRRDAGDARRHRRRRSADPGDRTTTTPGGRGDCRTGAGARSAGARAARGRPRRMPARDAGHADARRRHARRGRRRSGVRRRRRVDRRGLQDRSRNRRGGRRAVSRARSRCTRRRSPARPASRYPACWCESRLAWARDQGLSRQALPPVGDVVLVCLGSAT